MLLSSLNIDAQSQQDLFKQANELYKKGNYQEAIDSYEKALQQKKISPELYFNLANSYYKINKIAPSIYYYEKALELKPNDEDIQYNLALANKMKMDKIEAVPTGFSRKIEEAVSSIFQTDTWAMLTVFWSFLGLITFVIFLFSNQSNYKRGAFALMFVSLFLLLFSWYFSKISQKISQEKFAIIFVPKAELMAEPNLTSDKVVDLHEGTKIQILKQDEDWDLVKLPDGKKAWVVKSDVRVLD